MDRNNLGKKGEMVSRIFLEKEGYKIIGQNFVSKYGEIDIIALDKNEIVFIEVKTRSSKKYGEARDAVNIYKKKHIKKVAKYFILKNRLESKFVRFDVMEVYFFKSTYKIDHIKSVFW